MNNEQLIKSAHVWAVLVLLACALFGIARMSGNTIGAQNSNQNSNSNSNSGNANSSQSKNANMGNRNTGNATGEQAAMGAKSSQDQKFVMDVAMDGMMEVELGRWAAQKGTSEGVKQFGRRMVDDHTKAKTELMALASSKGITLPTALDAKHQANISKISKLTGADFDNAYVKMMLSDHKKAVSDFEKQSTKGADPDIKAFAGTTLPTLKEHLTMAQALSGTPGSDKTNPDASGNTNSNSNSNRGGSKNSNGNSNRNSNGNSNRP